MTISRLLAAYPGDETGKHQSEEEIRFQCDASELFHTVLAILPAPFVRDAPRPRAEIICQFASVSSLTKMTWGPSLWQILIPFMIGNVEIPNRTVSPVVGVNQLAQKPLQRVGIGPSWWKYLWDMHPYNWKPSYSISMRGRNRQPAFR